MPFLSPCLNVVKVLVGTDTSSEELRPELNIIINEDPHFRAYNGRSIIDATIEGDWGSGHCVRGRKRPTWNMTSHSEGSTGMAGVGGREEECKAIGRVYEMRENMKEGTERLGKQREQHSDVRRQIEWGYQQVSWFEMARNNYWNIRVSNK